MHRLLKNIEWVAKNLLALLLALVWFRPSRRAAARSRLSQVRRVLLVRIDNRVGEALLTTPVVKRLQGFEVHLLVHPKMVRVLQGLPGVSRLWVYERSWSTLLSLRAQRFDAVVNLGNWDTESVTSALVARWVGGHSVVLGPAHFPAGLLADIAVMPMVETRSEVAQRVHLVSPLAPVGPDPQLAFRNTPPFEVQGLESPFAVVNPGGRLSHRRVPPHLFAIACRELLRAGVTPLVTWGPGEEALAAAVCAECAEAKPSPPTTLDELASLMRTALLTVCNNSGPMHLAVAVGTPTLGLFYREELARWGYPASPHHMVDVTPALERGADAAPLVAHATGVLVTECLARGRR